MSTQAQFLQFWDYLITNCKEQPVIVPEEVQSYLNLITKKVDVKNEMTDSGKNILNCMQSTSIEMTAKDIASQLVTTPRCITGSIRKLITDGFVEKLGKEPVIYFLTNKGKNYKINED